MMCPVCHVGAGLRNGSQRTCEECGATWAEDPTARTAHEAGGVRSDSIVFPSRPLDDVMSLVLDAVILDGGEISDVPGDLIKNLAVRIECSYAAVAVAIRQLESVGFVQVERATHPDARRHNMLVRVALA